MSELDDCLLAQGGACEHLAKLFAYKRGMAESDFPCPPLSTTPWTDALTQLLARIAEIEARRCQDCRLEEGCRVYMALTANFYEPWSCSHYEDKHE